MKCRLTGISYWIIRSTTTPLIHRWDHMDLFSGISTQPHSDHAMPLPNGNALPSSLAIESQHEVLLPPITRYPAHSAAANEALVKLVSGIFNESFGFRPDGKPYRMGPKSVRNGCERRTISLLPEMNVPASAIFSGRRSPPLMEGSHGLNRWLCCPYTVEMA